MRTVAHLFLRVSSISAHGSGKDSYFWTLCLDTFHLGTVCVCLAWSSVLIASNAIWIPGVLLHFVWNWNWRSAGSEIRSIPCHWGGSNSSVSFTMSSGGQDGCFFIPRWNEEAATLESFDQRVKLFVSSTKKEDRYLCGSRLLSTFDPEGDTFRHVRENLTDVQLEAADG